MEHSPPPPASHSLREQLPLLVSGADHLKAGERVFWTGMGKEAARASADEAVLKGSDLKAVAELANVIFTTKYEGPEVRDESDLDAMANVARLLWSLAETRSAGGASVDEVVLGPLLALADSWLAELLFEDNSADERKNAFFGNGISPINFDKWPTGEKWDLPAKQKALEAKWPAASRLFKICEHLREVAGFVRVSAARLREAGKADRIEHESAKLSIAPERLAEILGK